ncbi:hypothetical protein Nepgr_021081 [Nepenthes gracilis]|uniref:Uncharacterized protein n=1 Tax=Nepenthes gracilis TaxID=150966 RepID=A0AAD3SY20_NEPGR|nr:hypothetical protein Nepgr_021081 [Nepenthes gracilis]
MAAEVIPISVCSPVGKECALPRKLLGWFSLKQVLSILLLGYWCAENSSFACYFWLLLMFSSLDAAVVAAGLFFCSDMLLAYYLRLPKTFCCFYSPMMLTSSSKVRLLTGCGIQLDALKVWNAVAVWAWSQCMQRGLACYIVSRYCRKPKSALPLAGQSADPSCLLMPADPACQLVQKRLVASAWCCFAETTKPSRSQCQRTEPPTAQQRVGRHFGQDSIPPSIPAIPAPGNVTSSTSARPKLASRLPLRHTTYIPATRTRRSGTRAKQVSKPHKSPPTNGVFEGRGFLLIHKISSRPAFKDPASKLQKTADHILLQQLPNLSTDPFPTAGSQQFAVSQKTVIPSTSSNQHLSTHPGEYTLFPGSD